MVNFEIQTYKTFLFFTSLLAEWRPYQLVYGASTNLYASPSFSLPFTVDTSCWCRIPELYIFEICGTFNTSQLKS